MLPQIVDLQDNTKIYKAIEKIFSKGRDTFEKIINVTFKNNAGLNQLEKF